jgi:predicted Rossmann-fold nucleotide-binding protein
VVNWEALAEEGTISKGDLDLFRWCETAEEAWRHISAFYEIED